MTPDLIEARANLDAILANNSPGLEALRAHVAVVAAENADAIGDEYDTRRLAGVLTTALSDATRRSDDMDTTIYGGMLVGVLADLADAGDEAAAVNVNDSVQSLPIALVRWGSEYARQRKGRR